MVFALIIWHVLIIFLFRLLPGMTDIVIVGSSHALKIGNALKKISLQDKSLNIKICARAGARFRDIPFPDFESFSQNTVICILPFGNDIFQPNSHKIESTSKGKIIHLRKNDPTSEETFLNLCKELEKKLSKAVSKIIIISNFYRHLRCCPAHTAEYVGILKHQNSLNQILHAFFKDKFTVIDHRKIVQPDRNQDGRSATQYSLHQVDTVHFTGQKYAQMAQILLDRCRS